MRWRVSRTAVNFCLDALLLVLFVSLAVVSVILEFVFPAATQADGWLLWSADYDSWSRVRFGVLAILAATIVLHVMLHWSWVCGVVASRIGKKKAGGAHDDPSRTLWGVGLLIVLVNLIGLVVAVASLMIEAPVTLP